MGKISGMRKKLSFVLAFILILAVPSLAFAAELSVTADSTSVKTGDTVTVTITVSAKHIAVAQGTFTYDPKLLKYASSNGGASDGYINLVSAESGGSSSLTAVIKFVSLAEGDAAINVSMQSILDYDGKDLGKTADAGIKVKAVASDAAGPGKSDAPGQGTEAPPVDFSKTGVAAREVQGTDAQMYIWRSLESLTLPSGFYDREVTYGGEKVGAAAIPDTDFILLYLSEKTGENAGYYIYDTVKNTLYPYVTITSVQANFTILWPDESIKAPEGFEKATLKWKEREMPAWTAKGSDNTVYLVYARNASGDTGFYLFDSADKSVQRFKTLSQIRPAGETAGEPAEASADQPVSNPAAGDKAGSGITISPFIFIVICAACVALIAGVAVLAILYRKAGKKG